MFSMTGGCERTDAEGEAASAGGACGQGLLGQSGGMAGLRRHDGGAELDALGLAPEQRRNADCVVGEDVRDPHRVESAGLEVAGRAR